MREEHTTNDGSPPIFVYVRIILISFAATLLASNIYYSTHGNGGIATVVGHEDDVSLLPPLRPRLHTVAHNLATKNFVGSTYQEVIETQGNENYATADRAALSEEGSIEPEQSRSFLAVSKLSGAATPFSTIERERNPGLFEPEPDAKQQESKHSKDKPLNIVVLYPDDMRHDSLSVAGNPIVETPFLDRLAGEGMRFTHNCVTTSICWVSRATWLTGQHMSRHHSVLLKDPPFYKRWNETFPSLLRDAGYYTGHIGKWQFSDYGFVKARYNVTDIVEGKHWVQDPKTNTRMHITDHNRNSAYSFLRGRPKDTPFFMGVAFYAPKALGRGDQQYNPKPETLQRYLNKTVQRPPDTFDSTPRFFHNKRFEGRTRYMQRFATPELYERMMKEYFSMITEVDAACQDIYEELERQGVLNNTMIIFTTDNGYFHAEHGLAGKWFPYQESIRVPLIIRDPRMPQSKRGSTDDSFTLNIDLAETILGAAKIEPPNSMQGRDIADIYLRDGYRDWRTEFFYDFAGLAGKNFMPKSLALVQKDLKLMKFPEWKEVALFNLTEDPLEEHDISKDPRYAEKVKSLLKRFDRLKRQAKFGSRV